MESYLRMTVPIMATLLIMTMMTITAIMRTAQHMLSHVSHRPVARDKFIKAGDKELKKVPMFQLCIDIYSNAD